MAVDDLDNFGKLVIFGDFGDDCKNFGILLKLQQVCKKFKPTAASQCLKSSFSNLLTDLTIVFPYRLWILDNLLGNPRWTTSIKPMPVFWKTYS